MVEKSEGGGTKLKGSTTTPPPPPPPPPPQLPRFKTAGTACSVTNQEIAKFWHQKRVVEEDHLLAAIKAAARIRARKLTEEEYKHFEESLNDYDDDSEENNGTSKQSDENNKELRVGIKDWWTKSKYAYLNQPAINSADKLKRKASTYVPQFFCYKPSPPSNHSFGIF